MGGKSVKPEDVDRWFSRPNPTVQQAQDLGEIEEQFRQLAKFLLVVLPNNADQTAAIRKLREAFATANVCLLCDVRTFHPWREPSGIERH